MGSQVLTVYHQMLITNEIYVFEQKSAILIKKRSKLVVILKL